MLAASRQRRMTRSRASRRGKRRSSAAQTQGTASEGNDWQNMQAMRDSVCACVQGACSCTAQSPTGNIRPMPSGS